MDIRILPSNIANMIAAGEVVQRPASVVKELMENAVDAGAQQVTVIISDAGRTLIQVIDDGKGMTPDQAVLCFERHATSKIAEAADLMDITTFGFRGEALASIAAVSEVTLTTRMEDMDTAVVVEYADSNHISTEETAAPVGSNFAVRNLFYNVPARRKFLKSDNVEFKHIVTEFIHVALTRPQIGFHLMHNGKNIYVLKPAKSLKFRILDLLGSNVANELVDVSTSTNVVNVTGFVGRPDMAKKSLGNQYLFVNGRFFRSPYFHKAVMKAYEHLIPEGVTPSYFLYLDVEPSTVDVNIHPTKTEIKFENDSVIFQVLMACIRECLGKNSFGDAIDFDTEGLLDIPVLTKHVDEFRPLQAPDATIDETYNPFDTDGFPSEPSAFTNTLLSGKPSAMAGMDTIPVDSMGNAASLDSYQSAPMDSYQSAPSEDYFPVQNSFQGFDQGTYGSYTPSATVDKKDDYGKLFEDRILPFHSVLVIQGKYILTNSRTGAMLIHIKRAVERILFDKFLSAISKNNHVTQISLFPISVYVGVENMCLFQEYSADLAKMGFDISPFGSDTIVVNGVPEGYSAEPGKVQTMVQDMLLILSDNNGSLPEIVSVNLAGRLAKLGAVGNSAVTNTTDAQALMEKLLSCENPEYTNSGQKIIALLNMDDIDKLF